MNGHIKIIIKDRESAFTRFLESKAKNEVCALVIGKKRGDTFTVTDVLNVANRHKDGENHFEVGKKAALNVLQRRGYTEKDLIGSLHTHTRGGADPSYDDCYFIPDGMLGIVVHPSSQTITYYNRQGFISKETAQ